MPVQRVNTVLITTDKNQRIPTPVEVHCFVQEMLGLTIEEVFGIQFGANRRTVFLKVTNAEIHKRILETYTQKLPFPSESNKIMECKIENTTGTPVNVKVLRLPWDTPRRQVEEELARYGKVIRSWVPEAGPGFNKTHTRTRYVRMMVERNIPSHVIIGGFRSQIIYDGQKPTCATCNEEGHDKKSCPKNKRTTSAGATAAPVDPNLDDEANVKILTRRLAAMEAGPSKNSKSNNAGSNERGPGTKNEE